MQKDGVVVEEKMDLCLKYDAKKAKEGKWKQNLCVEGKIDKE